MNWRKLINKTPSFTEKSFPLFSIAVTKIVQKDSSSEFIMPSASTMSFIGTVGEGLVYLSSPYTSGGTASDYEAYARVDGVRSMLFILMNMGVTVVSPIVAGAGMLPYGENQSHDWWMRFDRKLLRKCDCIAVLAVEGWQDSPGVQEEIELALVLGKPVYLIREITSLEEEK